MRNLSKALLLVLGEVLLVALVLVLLWKTGVHLSPELISTVVVLLGGLIFVVYRIIVSLVGRKQVCGREGMIGLRGRVVAPLNPEGVIRIQGELWKASCTDDSIGTDEEVRVVEIEGLRLVVKHKNDAGRQPWAS